MIASGDLLSSTRSSYCISPAHENSLMGERAAINFQLESFPQRIKTDARLVEQHIVDEVASLSSRTAIIHGHSRFSRAELLARKIMEEFQERGGIAVSVDALELAYRTALYPRNTSHPYQMLTPDRFDEFLIAIQELQSTGSLHSPGQDVLVVISGLSSSPIFDISPGRNQINGDIIRERLSEIKEIGASVVLTNLFSAATTGDTAHLVGWVRALHEPTFDDCDVAKMVRIDKETAVRISPFDLREAT